MVEARLERVECLGKPARLMLKTAKGPLRLLIPDPAKIVLMGDQQKTLGCGVQAGAPAVRIEYVVRADAKLATAGDVLVIEWLPK